MEVLEDDADYIDAQFLRQVCHATTNTFPIEETLINTMLASFQDFLRIECTNICEVNYHGIQVVGTALGIYSNHGLLISAPSLGRPLLSVFPSRDDDLSFHSCTITGPSRYCFLFAISMVLLKL